ncbi:STAS/SEC14 domain-containing protein [Saprospira sp. CCB-QB6]|uniref:DUF7793 family protein n=1 Tax=Saprospira sp. CCB-QB6 TaxID=3023936 RepID=UPI002348F05A|nr:STAS/SEC14 domain-containing protein [Saprospira sp. CCB-QB6]WCL81916.1 STAS/SEC14 domain-containing protein [Saprospira sp. CCB-QB6]
MAKKLGAFGQLEYWLLDNGILSIQAQGEKTEELTLAEVEYAIQTQAELFEQNSNQKILILANLGTMSKLSAEARTFLKSDQGKQVNHSIKGNALVAPNLLGRMMGNMLMGIFKQEYPIKLFKDEKQAIAWLLSL